MKVAPMRRFMLGLLMVLFSAQAFAAQQASEPSGEGGYALPPAAVFSLVSGKAENGDAAAMISLGRLYEHGHGVARNYSKAFEWYSKAAGKGLAEGYYNLGVCFEVGMGTVSDPPKAATVYAKAAEMGLPVAMHKMAGLYLGGTGVPRNTATAMQFLIKAADAGEAQACYDLGQVYMQGLYGQKQDYAAALGYFEKGAEKGSLQAMASLASYFDDGTPVRRNYVKALKWYLVLGRSGVQGEALATRVASLEGKMAASQVTNARTEAEDWIRQHASARGPQFQ